MPSETSYPDSVSRGEGSHPGPQANHNADSARKEEATGNATASGDKPIGPQSGFSPLMSSQEAHGNQNDETDYRKAHGSGY